MHALTPLEPLAPLASALALCLVVSLSCVACHNGGPPPANSGTPASSDGPTSAPPANADASSPPPSPSGTPGGETVVHADDDGKSFDVAQGTTVTFVLPSNAGTGYVWLPTMIDPTVLVQRGERTSDTAGTTPGSPKVDIYHFTAATAGTTSVEMTLKRPFGSGAPGRVVHATIHVK